jgi:hypothetical protein
MAWTTPGTATAGEVLTASFWNTQVRDNTADLRSYQNRFASFFRSAGNYTLNSTSWTSVDTTSDLTLAATVGDVIETGIYGLFGSANTVVNVDVVTRAGGSNVTSFGGRQAAPSGNTTGYYIPGCYSSVNADVNFGGMAHLTLTASDISAGNVTCRVQYRTSSAVNRTLYGSAPDFFYFYIKNLGPVTT